MFNKYDKIELCKGVDESNTVWGIFEAKLQEQRKLHEDPGELL